MTAQRAALTSIAGSLAIVLATLWCAVGMFLFMSGSGSDELELIALVLLMCGVWSVAAAVMMMMRRPAGRRATVVTFSIWTALAASAVLLSLAVPGQNVEVLGAISAVWTAAVVLLATRFPVRVEFARFEQPRVPLLPLAGAQQPVPPLPQRSMAEASAPAIRPTSSTPVAPPPPAPPPEPVKVSPLAERTSIDERLDDETEEEPAGPGLVHVLAFAAGGFGLVAYLETSNGLLPAVALGVVVAVAATAMRRRARVRPRPAPVPAAAPNPVFPEAQPTPAPPIPPPVHQPARVLEPEATPVLDVWTPPAPTPTPPVSADQRKRARSALVAVPLLVAGVGGAAGLFLAKSNEPGGDPVGVVKRYSEATQAFDCETIVDLRTDSWLDDDQTSREGKISQCERDEPRLDLDKVKSIEVSERDGPLAVVHIATTKSYDSSQDILLLQEDGEWKIDRIGDEGFETVPRSLPEYSVDRFLAALNEKRGPDCEEALEFVADSAIAATGKDREALVSECDETEMHHLDTSYDLEFELKSEDGDEAVVEARDGSGFGPEEIPLVHEGGDWKLAEVIWDPPELDPGALEDCSLSLDEFFDLPTEEQLAYDRKCGPVTDDVPTTTAPTTTTTTAPPVADDVIESELVTGLQQGGLGCENYDPANHNCWLNGGAAGAVFWITAENPSNPYPDPTNVLPYDSMLDEMCASAPLAYGERYGKGWMIATMVSSDGTAYDTPDLATAQQVADALGGQVHTC